MRAPWRDAAARPPRGAGGPTRPCGRGGLARWPFPAVRHHGAVRRRAGDGRSGRRGIRSRVHQRGGGQRQPWRAVGQSLEAFGAQASGRHDRARGGRWLQSDCPPGRMPGAGHIRGRLVDRERAPTGRQTTRVPAPAHRFAGGGSDYPPRTTDQPTRPALTISLLSPRECAPRLAHGSPQRDAATSRGARVPRSCLRSARWRGPCC